MGVETHFQHSQAIYAPDKNDVVVQRQQEASKTTVAEALHVDGFPERGKTFHTICTSNGSPYVNFQNRIMYGTFKMAQKMAGGEDMVAFTRILHRTLPDELVQVRFPHGWSLMDLQLRSSTANFVRIAEVWPAQSQRPRLCAR